MKKMVLPHLEEEEEGYHQHAQDSPKPPVGDSYHQLVNLVSRVGLDHLVSRVRSEPQRASSCSSEVDVWLSDGPNTQSTPRRAILSRSGF